MAGIEYSGFEYSKLDLFQGASMVLTPVTGTAIDVVDRIRKFFLKLGFGHVQYATPEQHDKMIVFTSQLAHVVSSAYILSDSALEHKGFSAGSFMDMTRVARLNENMWTELFIENSEYLSVEIEGLIERLHCFNKLIKTNNKTELIQILKRGSDRKNSSRERRLKTASSFACALFKNCAYSMISHRPESNLRIKKPLPWFFLSIMNLDK